jgi:small subunit ribosomal protein S18
MAMGKKRRRPMLRRKICRFCADKTLTVNFREPNSLRYFITERGKIIPRRISGNCAHHQRMVSKAIKLARQMALMPYSSSTV